MKDGRIGLVEENSLPDHRLVVTVQRQARAVHDPRALESARLDFKYVIFAVAIRIDPLSNRIPLIRWLDVE